MPKAKKATMEFITEDLDKSATQDREGFVKMLASWIKSENLIV